MTNFDIVVTLITIVYGLMLTDLFASLHKLIRARAMVRWHWLPLLSAWYIFLVILTNWWGISFDRNEEHWNNYLVFIGYGHMMVLLYLVVSTVLPDSVPPEGIDLKRYYFDNHRYFWGLLTAVFMLALIISVGAGMMTGKPVNYINVWLKLVFIGFTLTLVVTSKFAVHAVILSFFVLEIILEIVSLL